MHAQTQLYIVIFHRYTNISFSLKNIIKKITHYLNNSTSENNSFMLKNDKYILHKLLVKAKDD